MLRCSYFACLCYVPEFMNTRMPTIDYFKCHTPVALLNIYEWCVNLFQHPSAFNKSTVMCKLKAKFTSVFNQLDAQNLFHNKFYFMPLHVSSTCAHHQEVKIALHSLWNHHTYRCVDTRGYVVQF